MVAKVQRLEGAIVDQIAAGEVVERPASVVKELLENAIDAGATTISVDLEDGGRGRIRIVDDGTGMGRDDAVLCVRKRGTSRFMLVGGKPEEGESAEEAARREVLEETGLEVEGLTLLGEYVGDAANEPGRQIRSTTFLAEVPVGAEPEPRAEIEELRWHRLAEPATADLAPVLTEYVLPLLRRRASLED